LHQIIQRMVHDGDITKFTRTIETRRRMLNDLYSDLNELV
jgi:hypothetical protein